MSLIQTRGASRSQRTANTPVVRATPSSSGKKEHFQFTAQTTHTHQTKKKTAFCLPAQSFSAEILSEESAAARGENRELPATEGSESRPVPGTKGRQVRKAAPQIISRTQLLHELYGRPLRHSQLSPRRLRNLAVMLHISRYRSTRHSWPGSFVWCDKRDKGVVKLVWVKKITLFSQEVGCSCVVLARSTGEEEACAPEKEKKARS